MCLALSALAPRAAGQFTSGVSLVEVYASVLDASGGPVTGLSADDFIVEEDGRRQQVQTFAASDFPLSLAIAVDRSFSMSQARLTQVLYAVQRLLGELRDEDRVTLLAIGSEVEVLTPLSTDHRAAYDALIGLAPWGTTPLFDAATQAIDRVQDASGRRALILITDGDDRYSASTAAEMVVNARRHDVLVYPVSLRRTSPPVLVELAGVTGARATAVPRLEELPAALSSIARELRLQYLLGYVPSAAAPQPNRTAWRSIVVRVTRPGLRVRARDGYYAGR
jgi:Ca-activated chloride channel family protein